MLDTWLKNPLIPALGCLVWVAIAVWVVSLVHWIIQGEVEGWAGALFILVLLFVGTFTVRPTTPIMTPILFSVVVLGGILFPWIRGVVIRHQMQTIDHEQLVKAYERLALSPSDPWLRVRVAEVAWTCGLRGHAMRLLEKTLEPMSRQLQGESLTVLLQWQRQGVQAHEFSPLTCMSCKRRVDPGTPFCHNCGHGYLQEHAQSSLSWTSVEMKLLVSWIILGAIGILAPMAYSSLTGLAQTLVTSAILVVGLGAIVFVHRGR
jgi:hypothetical protein